MILRDNGFSLYDSERQTRRYRVKRAFASFTQQVHPDMTREIIVSPALYELLEDNAPEILGGSLGIRVRLEPQLSGTAAHAIGVSGTRRHSFAMRLPGARLPSAPPAEDKNRFFARLPLRRLYLKALRFALARKDHKDLR